MLPNAKQTTALKHLKNPNIRCVFLTGGAGTGKTAALAMSVGHNTMDSSIIHVTATTNTAAEVLKGQLQKTSGTILNPPKTLHGTFGVLPIVNMATRDGKSILDFPVPKSIPDYLKGKILIVDEVSMLAKKWVNFLLDNRNEFKKLILVGDHAQIPPVNQKSFDWSNPKEKRFNKIEFTENMRVGENKELGDYNTESRARVLNGKLPLQYKNATFVPDVAEGIKQAQRLSGDDFLVIAYKNKTVKKIAAEYSGLSELSEGMTVRLTSGVNLKHKEDSKISAKIPKGALVVIEDIFTSFKAMVSEHYDDDFMGKFWAVRYPALHQEEYEENTFFCKVRQELTGISFFIPMKYGWSSTDINDVVAEYGNEAVRKFNKAYVKKYGKKKVKSVLLNSINVSEIPSKLKKYKMEEVEGMTKSDLIESNSVFWNFYYPVVNKKIPQIPNTPTPTQAASTHYGFSALVGCMHPVASTAHSSQGQSIDTVVIMWQEIANARTVNERKHLLYTALSRAKSNIIIVGEQDVV